MVKASSPLFEIKTQNCASVDACMVIYAFTAAIDCSGKTSKVSKSSRGQSSTKESYINLQNKSENYFLPSITLVPVFSCSCTGWWCFFFFAFYFQLDRPVSHTPCFCCLELMSQLSNRPFLCGSFPPVGW